MRTRPLITQDKNRVWKESRRRGAITVWLILAIPVLMTLFCVLLEVGNLWLARVELTNALEASALAAVEEWGDNGGGDTLIPREVGRTFAFANTLNGVPIDYAIVDPGNPLNYNPAVINDNNSCAGTMIFGAIIEDDPEFVFDSCVVPSCLAGNVVLDVSGESSLAGNNNEWGISFQPSTSIPSDLRITRVIYIFPEECDDGTMPRFDFSSAVPTVSFADTDCDPNILVVDNCQANLGKNGQADVFGIDRTLVSFQIEVDVMNNPCDPMNGTPVTGVTNTLSTTLALDFPDGDDDDEGFDLEERIRFGANVTELGGGQVGGDEIGQCPLQVIVCFNNGTSIMGEFVDTDDKKNECLKCAEVASWGMKTILNSNMVNNCPTEDTTLGNHGLIIHPTMTPDIPCPPAAAGEVNNGQSLAFVGAQGDARAFAVRAQATYQVPSICCELFCVPVGPFFVSAKADALYDCEECVPRLYHIEEDNFHCAVDCFDQ